MYFIFDKMPIQESICYIAEHEKFVLKLPWQIQAQHIGFLVAKDKGFYENGGGLK